MKNKRCKSHQILKILILILSFTTSINTGLVIKGIKTLFRTSGTKHLPAKKTVHLHKYRLICHPI